MKRRIYRSDEQRVIAGVFGGLAERFNHDVVLWRLGAVVCLVLTGLMPGVLLYFLAALIIPTKGSADYVIE
ncbi:PspC domain-containing protein [Candidatus Kaiserbacteria bacterium]|nr:PspC domain-containing protein [Candidatus Kaiserbacteria bacterium]